MKTVIRVSLLPGGMTQDGEPGVQAAALQAAWGEPSFASFPARSRTFPLAMAASLCAHLLGAVIVPEAIQIASTPRVNVVKELIAKSRVEHLLLRVPPRQPILLPSARKAVARLASKRKLGTSPPPKVLPAAPAPAVAAASQAAAILLQPQALAPEVAKALHIRSFTVWSGRSPRTTPAPITAGSPEPLPSTVVAGPSSRPDLPLPAPPLDAVPSPPIQSERAGLTLPPSGSSPIRSEAQPAPLGSDTAGERAAVIAISPLPPAPDEVLDIPPGNFLITGGDGAATTPGASLPKPPAPTRAETVRSVQAEAALPAPKSAVAPAAAKVPPAQRESAAATVSNAPPPESSSQDTSHPSVSPSAALSPAAASNPAPAPAPAVLQVQIQPSRAIPTPSGAIQVRGNQDGSTSLTYPRDGQFDVVIVQSGPPEAAGDLTGLLSGKPIHTVFIHVGEPREWVLQYCLPGGSGEGVRQSGMVVTLGSPAPLKAPFLLEAQLPPGLAWRSSSHQVFHGVLSANGKLEQLRAVKSGANPIQVIDFLARWVFRPATAGKEAKPVEVLLIIPPSPVA